jgi:hypothetical protein
MVVVLTAAILGGFWPGIAAAVVGFLLLNFYFTEPYHTFVISHPDDVLALAVFVVVAAAVSAVVGLAARRTGEAARASVTPRCCSISPAMCCVVSTPWPRCWTGCVKPSDRKRSPCSNTGPARPSLPPASATREAGR